MKPVRLPRSVRGACLAVLVVVAVLASAAASTTTTSAFLFRPPQLRHSGGRSHSLSYGKSSSSFHQYRISLRSLAAAAASSPSSSSSSSTDKAPISSRIIHLRRQEGTGSDVASKKCFQLEVDLPKGAGAAAAAAAASGDAAVGGPKLQALLTVEPVLSGPSVLVEIRYQVPFELSVEPRNNLAVCTADGPSPTLSEKTGDVLRFASQWTLELPRQVGIAATAAAFSGGLSWQPSLFDVMKAVQWEQVVNALVSNTQERTSEVVLIFERPVGEDKEE